MTAIKKTISISEDVLREASAIESNFSAVVEAALIVYLRQVRLQKAAQSFGKWESRAGSSTDIVNNLRRLDDREYINQPSRKKAVIKEQKRGKK